MEDVPLGVLFGGPPRDRIVSSTSLSLSFPWKMLLNLSFNPGITDTVAAPATPAPVAPCYGLKRSLQGVTGEEQGLRMDNGPRADT